MKIYIENYDPKNITNILLSKKVDDSFRNNKTLIEVYSNEGIYNIENNKIYKIIYNNDNNNIKKIINYFKEKDKVKYNLIVDYSQTEREECFQIPINHMSRKIEIFKYSLSEKSNVELIIKGNYENKEIELESGLANHYLSNDKYKNLVIFDFYFNVKREMDINDMNLMDDIQFFINLLF
jgi:hypothetical protein